jgi:hypothetical protein
VILKPENRRYIITRSDSVQIEFDELVDTITVKKIKWTGPCEYEMIRDFKAKRTQPLNSPHPILRYINEIPVRVKIVETGVDYCVFESKEDGEDIIYRDTMQIYR